MQRLVIAVLLVLLSSVAARAASLPPELRERGGVRQLFVDGRPFLVLGGEVDNSASSSPAHMEAVWARAQAQGVNTLLAPVTWDQLEPEPGRFDFAVADALVAQARKHDMRIGLLWLGAFKNARSTYAPTWVRADRVRFPRAVTAVPTGRREPSSPRARRCCRCLRPRCARRTRAPSPR